MVKKIKRINKTRLGGNDTTSNGTCKATASAQPGDLPGGKTRNSRTHFNRIRKTKRCFSPTRLDKGTLDTAAWIVFVGVLRSKQRWKTKRAVPLKMYAPQARTFFARRKKGFPSALGGQWLLFHFNFFFFCTRKGSTQPCWQITLLPQRALK